jgi:acyl-CoA thioesterase-1
MTLSNDDRYAEWHLDTPFWRSKRMYGESLFFIREPTATYACARLLFPPNGEVDLISASQEIQYKTGIDYVADPDSGIVSLLPDSKIPFIDRRELYRDREQEGAIAHKRDEERVWLHFAEGHYFHDLQSEASYHHDSVWPYYIPEYQGDALARTIAKLRNRSPVSICVCGDSISAGANASALTGAAPYMPPYPDLVAEGLRRTYNAPVTLKNFAVGGKTSQHGIQVADDIAKESPDLIVVAYGMNDANCGDVEAYRNNISRIIDITRQDHSDVDYILVAPMLGNPEWQYTPREVFVGFRDALTSLCEEGMALADMTQVWSDLLELKSYHDLTGNGVNHPNDFGHRVYADVLLELLVDTDMQAELMPLDKAGE